MAARRVLALWSFVGVRIRKPTFFNFLKNLNAILFWSSMSNYMTKKFNSGHSFNSYKQIYCAILETDALLLVYLYFPLHSLSAPSTLS